jgi:hypothetical protein
MKPAKIVALVSSFPCGGQPDRQRSARNLGVVEKVLFEPNAGALHPRVTRCFQLRSCKPKTI